MSILKQVLKEYAISQTSEPITDRTDIRVESEKTPPDRTDKRASVSNVSDRSEGFETQSVVSNIELQDILGADWDEVSGDPHQIDVARLWVTEAKQVTNGIIPERYTQLSDCKFCGPVFTCEGYPLKANNCPWCFNRIKGLPIPKEGK